jgi:hypothetical protein
MPPRRSALPTCSRVIVPLAHDLTHRPEGLLQAPTPLLLRLGRRLGYRCSNISRRRRTDPVARFLLDGVGWLYPPAQARNQRPKS